MWTGPLKSAFGKGLVAPTLESHPGFAPSTGASVVPSSCPAWPRSSLDAATCIACQQVTHLGQGDQIEVTWDGVLERRGRYREVQRLVLPHPRCQTVDQPSGKRVAGPDPVHNMGQVVFGADEELPTVG